MKPEVAAIDWGPMIDTVLWSGFGLAVILVGVLAVLGFSRAPDLYRAGRQVAAVGWFGLGAVCSAAASIAVIWVLIAMSESSPLR